MGDKIKIAAIGADGGKTSGHSRSFCQKINSGLYPAEVVAIYASNTEEAKEVAEYAGIPLVAETAEQAIEAADAVVVMHRNGNLHKQYVLCALEKGKSVFVDKPLACTVEDAKQMIETAREKNLILCSGSTVMYAEFPQRIAEYLDGEELLSGYIAFPLVNEEEFGGIHFYSHHMLAEAWTIFGEKIKSVTATCVGGNVVVVAEYDTFPLIMNFAANYSGLHIAAYTKSGKAVMKELSLYQTDTVQLETFLEAVLKNEQPQSELELLWPVVLSCAIEQSMKTGEKVPIKDI